MRRRIGGIVRRQQHLTRTLGFVNGTLYQLRQRWHQVRTPREPWTLRARSAAHPLACRPGTGDREVFEQIFLQEEYACVRDLADVRLVVGCGANVGYAAAYLLSCYPHCRLVAVEPDPANYAMLEANLAPCGRRARTLAAAVWSHSARLVIADPVYRDGREWSRQVRSAAHGELGSVTAVGGDALGDGEYIDLLKMDIEGAEAVVFGGDLGWLDRVGTIVLELQEDTYGHTGAKAIHEAFASRGVNVQREDEIMLATHPRRRRTIGAPDPSQRRSRAS